MTTEGRGEERREEEAMGVQKRGVDQRPEEKTGEEINCQTIFGQA